MDNPLFSVVIPVFNRETFIGDTILSILNQTYQRFEIIVVDDGSTDSTKDKILEIKDYRINYIFQENRERAAARNTGTNTAVGDYVTFLDSDDRFYKNHLMVAKEMIKTYSQPEIFHLNYEIKDESGTVIVRAKNRKGNLGPKLLKGNHLSCIGVFIRSDIAKANLFNENRTLSGTEDWELWMRLSCKYHLHYSNIVTSYMIQHVERSVEEIDVTKLINRIHLAYQLVLNNVDFIKKYSTHKYEVLSHLECYISLHLILGHKKILGFRYFIRAMYHYPPVLFYRKSMGIIKNLLFTSRPIK